MQANTIDELTRTFPILAPVLRPLVQRAEEEAAADRAKRRADLAKRRVELERDRLKAVERHAEALRKAEAAWKAAKAVLDQRDAEWAQVYRENTSARMVYDREMGAVLRELEGSAPDEIDAFLAEADTLWRLHSTVAAETEMGYNGQITTWTNRPHVDALRDALARVREAARELRYIGDDAKVSREIAKLRASIPRVPRTKAEADAGAGAALAAA